MEKDNRQTPEDKFHYYSGAIRRDMGNLLKWLLLAVVVGCIAGAFSTLFSFVLKAVTGYRKAHLWTFFLLPLFGLCIVFLYEKFGKDDGGTNQVLSTVRSQDDVPWRSGPLIFISTALTHLAGGSAGREGAAIQLGGSIANLLGRWIHLDEEDRHVIVMCGMSAAFSALFGTPMAAAVFSLEVVSVGVMYYTALMPCMIASLIASRFAAGMGVTPEAFHVVNIPALSLETGLKMGVVALGCAVISIVFCIILNETARFYGRFFSNKYARVVAGAVLVILEMLTPAMFFLNLALACFGVAAAAFFTVDLYVLVPLWVVLSAIFLLFLRPLLNRRHAAQSTATGMGQYVGKTAKVLEAVGKDSGVIGIFGERWEARTEYNEKIPVGSNVVIERNDNLTMYVKKEK